MCKGAIMSIWHPESGITYNQYLQTNSFVRDITGQIKLNNEALEVKVSDQTKALVASNQQLTREFSNGFDSINGTLEWGINRLEYVLHDMNASIDSLHADFNYSMGLLLEEVHIHNKLLTNLLSKLDAIHKTIESPLLTQAREFYNIGCERLSKGLLDKALEAFIQAESKNDTDFFTQFHIGKLYLYGIDDDNDILDLKKAKKHLLFASRFAKAEITIDPKFARFAAEALLHASIAIYAQLGDKVLSNNTGKTKQLLEDAKRLIFEAVTLYPQLSESYYHAAKYSALLNEPQIAIPNLENAITADRNYAIKVDIDHAFDPIRSHVLTLLLKLKDGKKLESENKLKQAVQLLGVISSWHPEKFGVLASQFSKCKKKLSNAQTHFDSQTYFGFLDAILLLDQLETLLPQLKSKRIEELDNRVNQLTCSIRDELPCSGEHSQNVENIIQETNAMINQAYSRHTRASYEIFTSIIELLNSAHLKAIKARKLAQKEDEDKRRHQKVELEATNLEKMRYQQLKDYSFNGALSLGAIGGLGGCMSCVSNGDFNMLSGAMLCAIVGAVLGAIIGYNVHPN